MLQYLSNKKVYIYKIVNTDSTYPVCSKPTLCSMVLKSELLFGTKLNQVAFRKDVVTLFYSVLSNDLF